MKHIKKITYLMGCLCLTSLTQSCQKNIDLDPEGIITEDTYYSSPDDYDKALVDVYDRLNYGDDNLWLESSTDNAVTTHEWNPGYELGYGFATSFSPFPEMIWDNDYVSIQRANTIIQNIDLYKWQGDDEKAKRAQVLAEAKTLRAYFYLDLVSVYGKPMLVWETPDDPNNLDKIKQATNPKEVFDHIIADLQESVPNLPEYPEYKSKIGQAAGRGILARVAAAAAGYLKDKSYFEIVRDETAKVLQMDYSIEGTKYEDLFTSDNEELSEVILVREYNLEQKNGWGQWYPQSVGGYCVTTPTADLVDAFEYINTPKAHQPYSNKDPRFYATIYAPGSEFRDGYFNTVPNNVEQKEDGLWYFKSDGDYGDLNDKPVIVGDVLNEGGGGEWNKTPTGFCFKKYFGEEETWDTYNNFIVMRLAEIALLRAEALVELGEGESEARSLVQTLRDRAGNTNPIDEVLANQYHGSLLELIHNETRVELANEGLRPMDIRRWGVFKDAMKKTVDGIKYRTLVDENGKALASPQEVQYHLVNSASRSLASENYFWWPIPQVEMDLDKGKIEQNSGW